MNERIFEDVKLLLALVCDTFAAERRKQEQCLATTKTKADKKPRVFIVMTMVINARTKVIVFII